MKKKPKKAVGKKVKRIGKRALKKTLLRGVQNLGSPARIPSSPFGAYGDQIARLRDENKALIDLLFVKDDQIRELLLYKRLVDDGHAFRIGRKIDELKMAIETPRRTKAK